MDASALLDSAHEGEDSMESDAAIVEEAEAAAVSEGDASTVGVNDTIAAVDTLAPKLSEERGDSLAIDEKVAALNEAEDDAVGIIDEDAVVEKGDEPVAAGLSEAGDESVAKPVREADALGDTLTDRFAEALTSADVDALGLCVRTADSLSLVEADGEENADAVAAPDAEVRAETVGGAVPLSFVELDGEEAAVAESRDCVGIGDQVEKKDDVDGGVFVATGDRDGATEIVPFQLEIGLFELAADVTQVGDGDCALVDDDTRDSDGKAVAETDDAIDDERNPDAVGTTLSLATADEVSTLDAVAASTDELPCADGDCTSLLEATGEKEFADADESAEGDATGDCV